MKNSRILVIDDEDLFREDIATMLRRDGYDCHTAENAAKGLEAARTQFPDIILSDIVMPDRLGTEIIADLQSASPGAAVIMLTAFGDLESALRAFRQGAVDYLLKPIAKEELLEKIGRLEEQRRLIQEVAQLRKIASAGDREKPMIGESPRMRAVKDQIGRMAAVNTPLLISGESGVGKEIVAREIHRLGDRSEAPFLAINCGAIPDQLLESELFGHVKGAFTGASGERIGFFELASDGILLLDEIGDMPLNLQTKLLRALEQREFYRVGSSRPTPLRARILSSTNQDLSQMIASKCFREDLYYRLNVIEISVPPLRCRREDIPRLADFFLAQLSHNLRRQKRSLSKEALAACMGYDWPGNVRQLRNIMERAVILSQDSWIQLEDLPPETRGGLGDFVSNFESDDLRAATKQFERQFIESMIRKCDGNRERAAEKMNINPSTLYRKLTDDEGAN